MAQAVKTRRVEKAFFSDAEIRTLIDLFSQKKDILLQKFNFTRTYQLKTTLLAAYAYPLASPNSSPE